MTRAAFALFFATAIPALAAPQERLFTGVFDAGWSNAHLTQEQWNAIMARWSEIQLDTVVLQYSIYRHKGGKVAYYPTEVPGLASYRTGGGSDLHLYERALRAAQKAHLKVFLATYYDATQWWPAEGAQGPDEKALKEGGALAVAVIEELEKKYKVEFDDTIAGYYLPHELASWPWSDAAWRSPLVSHLLRPVRTAVDATNRRLLVAPFPTDGKPPEDGGAFLKMLLADWQPHIVAWQDGVGTECKPSVEDVEAHNVAAANAVREAGVEFWVDMEVFSKRNIWPAREPAASMRRVLQQSQGARAAQASKVLAYDASVFEHRNWAFYDAYRAYLGGQPPPQEPSPAPKPTCKR